MGYEDEYGPMDAVEWDDSRGAYREALDAEGLQEAELEQLRQASFEGLCEAFEPFLVSRAVNAAGQAMDAKRTYRRAREKVAGVDPAPDAVVVDRYLQRLAGEKLPDDMPERDAGMEAYTAWATGRTDRERIEAHGLTVAAAAIADTLDPWEKWDLSREAQVITERGAYALPDSDEMRKEAATVWQMFR